MSDDSSRPSRVLARTPALAPGRLATLALVGGAAGSVPLPLVTWGILRRVKGAVAHDIASRHGLSLTPEARDVLSAPMGGRRPSALLSTVAFVAKRVVGRLGPLGVVPPVSAWLEVYALGLLFDRYVERVRTGSAVRIDVVEARKLRDAIDQSIRRAFSLRTQPSAGAPVVESPEDARDPATRLFDGILLGLAAVPSAAQRRLEAAFDDIVGSVEGFGRG
jgi:hypothetical protein